MGLGYPAVKVRRPSLTSMTPEINKAILLRDPSGEFKEILYIKYAAPCLAHPQR